MASINFQLDLSRYETDESWDFSADIGGSLVGVASHHSYSPLVHTEIWVYDWRQGELRVVGFQLVTLTQTRR